MSPMSWNTGSHVTMTFSGSAPHPLAMSSTLTRRLRWVTMTPLGGRGRPRGVLEVRDVTRLSLDRRPPVRDALPTAVGSQALDVGVELGEARRDLWLDALRRQDERRLGVVDNGSETTDRPVPTGRVRWHAHDPGV